MDFSFALTPDLIAVFITLFALELVLGVDNVLFISILAGKLPKDQQNKARLVGLSLAMILRIALVLFAGWIITLKNDVVTIAGIGFSWKDFILIAGGAFLLYKAGTEIVHKIKGTDDAHAPGGKLLTFRAAIIQILMLDLVFSLDSVITAVGMTSNMIVIICAVVVSFAIMLFASKYIFEFVNTHPTLKMLALAFLLLIGGFLVVEGFGVHIDKAFIYTPMAFAVLVEVLNLLAGAQAKKRAQAAKAGDSDDESAPLHA